MKTFLKLFWILVFVFTFLLCWSDINFIVKLHTDNHIQICNDSQDYSISNFHNIFGSENVNPENSLKAISFWSFAGNHIYSYFKYDVNNNYIIKIWQPPKLA